MNDALAGWYEITRTRFSVGQAEFDFADGPAEGRHMLDVGAGLVPAAYAVMTRPGLDGELVYQRKAQNPGPGWWPAGHCRGWAFEFVRAIATPNLVRITCPSCGRTSYHPMDLGHGWCAACSSYTQLGVGELPSIGALVAARAELAAARVDPPHQV